MHGEGLFDDQVPKQAKLARRLIAEIGGGGDHRVVEGDDAAFLVRDDQVVDHDKGIFGDPQIDQGVTGCDDAAAGGAEHLIGAQVDIALARRDVAKGVFRCGDAGGAGLFALEDAQFGLPARAGGLVAGKAGIGQLRFEDIDLGLQGLGEVDVALAQYVDAFGVLGGEAEQFVVEGAVRVQDIDPLVSRTGAKGTVDGDQIGREVRAFPALVIEVDRVFAGQFGKDRPDGGGRGSV